VDNCNNFTDPVAAGCIWWQSIFGLPKNRKLGSRSNRDRDHPCIVEPSRIDLA
jgi:hypothetical protein